MIRISVLLAPDEQLSRDGREGLTFSKSSPMLDLNLIEKAQNQCKIEPFTFDSLFTRPSLHQRNMPKCHIFAMEHDVLRDEEILFFSAAQNAGGQVQLTIWDGAMHIEQSFSKSWSSRSIGMDQRVVAAKVFSLDFNCRDGASCQR